MRLKNFSIGSLRKSMIKKWAIKTIAVLVLGASLITPSLKQPDQVSAEGVNTPRFNFLPGDVEMLRVAKTTQTTWGDPITANVGDRVAFLFYYHNGIVDSVAHHTKVRVDLPIDESNKLVAKSWLWSQETAAISDTVVDGQIIGQSGATINLPSNGRIQYVPGSTKWFPNRSQTPTAMPDGITSNSGLDLGDINGCWEFAGFVTFLADIKGEASLVMDKTVAHPGDTTWVKEITANPGDSVAYHLGIRNDGDITANAVTVKDILPTHMTYEPGTTYIYTKDHPEGIKQSDTLFTTGISLPNMIPGDNGIIYVTYRTKISLTIPSGAWALNNVAKVFMGGVEQDQDQAKVVVTANRGLTIDKKVSNGVSWVEESSAKLGDSIDYRIIVRNTGNIPIESVFVRDVLPVFTSYITGSTKVNGNPVGDVIVTSNGLSIGTLQPGQEVVIVFSVSTKGCPPIGGYTLTNTAYVRGSGFTEISDIAVTKITVTAANDPVISIN